MPQLVYQVRMKLLQSFIWQHLGTWLQSTGLWPQRALQTSKTWASCEPQTRGLEEFQKPLPTLCIINQ